MRLQEGRSEPSGGRTAWRTGANERRGIGRNGGLERECIYTNRLTAIKPDWKSIGGITFKFNSWVWSELYKPIQYACVNLETGLDSQGRTATPGNGNLVHDTQRTTLAALTGTLGQRIPKSRHGLCYH
jgi:hypothetical protein